MLTLVLSTVWFVSLINQAYFQGAFEVSEAREGVVVNEIKEFGTWVLPLRYGEVVPSKPPLFHWLTALATYYSSPLSDLGLRLISIVSGIMSLFCIFYSLKKMARHNPEIEDLPKLTVLMLSSTYGFIAMLTDGRVDMLFMAIFTVTQLATNYIILAQDFSYCSKFVKILIGLLLALGILARGPLMLVMFFLILIAGSFSKSGIFKLKDLISKSNILYLLILPILLTAPWYIASKVLGKPELVSRQIIFENFDRFFGSEKIISKPFWFYFQHIWEQGSPWIVLGAISLILFFKNKLYIKHSLANSILKINAYQLLACILFLSLSAGKRKAYLLPLLPSLSICCGILFIQTKDFIANIKLFRSEKISLFNILSNICLGSLVSGIVLKIILPLGLSSQLNQSFFIGLSLLSWMSLIIPTLCVFVLYAISQIIIYNPKLQISLFCKTWIICLMAYITFPCIFYLTKGESHSFKLLAQRINNTLPNTDLKIIKNKDDESFDSLLFYLGRRVRLHQLSVPESNGTYIARKSWFDQQTQDFNDNAEIYFTGKRPGDKDEKEVIVFKYLIDGDGPSSDSDDSNSDDSNIKDMGLESDNEKMTMGGLEPPTPEL